ncbi:MAG: efflux RND transporter permease subunit [Calditrichaeota bacterium]|nr:efflux RND transporter permease subunit [Calditrichota bacterium]
MNIAKFSVKNSVLINLFMIGLFIYGGVSLLRMPRELSPQISFNWVFVTVIYTGASSSEIESLIIDPIESEIQDVDKIDEIQSTAGDGYGFLLIKFDDVSDAEFRELYTDLKGEIDKVALPDDAEDPIIDDFGSGDFKPIIMVNISYSIPEDNIQKIVEDMEEDISDIPGVAKVQVSGLAEREIWVEVDPAKLNALHVSFDEIVFALKRRNLNLPGGRIKFGRKEYIIRSLGEYQSIEEIGKTVIRRGVNGEVIRIKDIAEVKDRREDIPVLSRLNGEKAITFSISKKSDANSLDIINDVKQLVKDYRLRVPDGVDFMITGDDSVYIHRILNILRNNAISGMILIFIVLYIFLGKWNAFLASLGIPICFFITFIFMHQLGYSLNSNSLFALIMALGIIVDGAIIVLENCHRYRMMGYNSYQSALLGTNEVITPILSSVGTNIAAFLPLMLLPGITGKFMRITPLVFSLALTASLFEVFFLLPSHYADWTAKSKVNKRGELKFFTKLRSLYGRLLIKSLRRRYVILAILVVTLIGSLGLIPLIGVQLFGYGEFDQFKVFVKFPEGTNLKENERIMKKFEAEALSLPKSALKAVILNTGLMQKSDEWVVKKSVSQMVIELKPEEEREISTEELMEMLRGKIKHISGPSWVQFERTKKGPPSAKPISVKVQGKYMDRIKKAALALQDSIRKINGVYDVKDDSPPGKDEIRLIVDEDKAALFGFSAQDIARNVRYAFEGIKAIEYRDGDDEIDVIIKYDESNRSSIDDVLNLRITGASGQTVALGEMVKFEIKAGRTEIKRFNQKRTIMVTGEINESKTTLDRVNLRIQKLFPEIEKKFAGVTFSVGGAFEEFMNTFTNILSLFTLGLILIFIILGAQFKSYSQPLIVLTIVPFSFIGAILGLIISGDPFSISAMYGFVALAGIVVNDAIVLVHFVNKRRAAGQTNIRFWTSIVNAGRLRLRPILLTSVTTIAGVAPMAFGIGGMSQTWSPLANVILFGLLVSTILTLFIIPCIIAVLDDIKGVRKKKNALQSLAVEKSL